MRMIAHGGRKLYRIPLRRPTLPPMSFAAKVNERVLSFVKVLRL